MAQDRNELPGADIEGNIVDGTYGAGRISFFIALYIIMDQFADFDHILPVSSCSYAASDISAFDSIKFDSVKFDNVKSDTVTFGIVKLDISTFDIAKLDITTFDIAKLDKVKLQTP
jgi:hypothetical protein